MTSLSLGPSTSAASRADLAEYLEDVARRLERGEPVDFEKESAQHPDYAAQLRELWPALQVLISIGQQPAGGAKTAAEIGEHVRQLGEFRIVRELGRGGMGVVYEAEQESLGRRVALKVLPFAAVLDPRQLARFQNEARAAASLHHTNIVPVFSVGCERGVHYYAMQLIEGRSLAEVVKERLGNRGQGTGEKRKSGNADEVDARQAQGTPDTVVAENEVRGGRSLGFTPPHSSFLTHHSSFSIPSDTLRALLDTTVRPAEFYTTVAQLGIQAAEALAHAHDVGIVHRDIKPSNLLVDLRGKLWVTDFGLARLGTDAGVTMTGDVLGTLRYMSPEQASGKPASVDHRSDIYSLGATLYELATGRPVFAETNRERLLAQLLRDEPTPPRRLVPGLPADLETILLKTLSKEPESRYHSADELADDLRRFLDHRPITARRPTLWQRGRKLLARHRVLVTSVLLTLCLVSSVSSLLLWRAHRRTVAAYEAEKKQATIATANLAVAKKAIDQFYVEFIGRDLSRRQTLTPQQQRLLEQAITFYEQIAAQNEENPEFWLEAAKAYYFIGETRYNLGDHERAETALVHALRICQEVDAANSADPMAVMQYAKCWDTLGILFTCQGRYEEAEEAYETSLVVGEDFMRRFPEIPPAEEISATALRGLGEVYALTGRVDEAVETTKRAFSAFERLERINPKDHHGPMLVSDQLEQLARIQMLQGSFQEAREYIERAIEKLKSALNIDPTDALCVRKLCDQLRLSAQIASAARDNERSLSELRLAADELDRIVVLAPGSLHNREVQSEVLSDLIEKALATGAKERLAEDHQRLRDCLDSLERDFPDFPSRRAAIAVLRYNLGTHLAVAGELALSRAEFHVAERLLLAMLREFPDDEEQRHRLAMCQYNLASAQMQLSERPEAESTWTRSLATWEDLTRRHPGNSEYQSRVGAVLSSLAIHARDDRHRPLESIALSRRALEHQVKAREIEPKYEQCDEFLWQHHTVLSETLLRLGDHQQAARVEDDALGYEPVHPQHIVDAARFRMRCADAAALDDRLNQPERTKQAHAHLNRAAELLREAGQRTEKTTRALAILGLDWKRLAEAAEKHGLAMPSVNEELEAPK